MLREPPCNSCPKCSLGHGGCKECLECDYYYEAQTDDFIDGIDDGENDEEEVDEPVHKRGGMIIYPDDDE